MPKRTGGTSRGPGQQSGGSAPLPDLSGIDLRTLRTSDDSAVAAAVEWALRVPEKFRLFWAAEGGEGRGPNRCAGTPPRQDERHSVPELGADVPRDPANFLP
ncbi:hypothetical protein [Streptomyces iconiensis]|uniref:FXSXX-COOH protein n=1 Tax=Streptomyces iconiensis TaxID=1384038 RepID=A0ABT7A1P4_9ACTN|nr:hypothetical protein [Streptomyces iconiensis]MDJ1135263.1 hypothetical protein [Streptomyces iconiensis]